MYQRNKLIFFFFSFVGDKYNSNGLIQKDKEHIKIDHRFITRLIIVYVILIHINYNKCFTFFYVHGLWLYRIAVIIVPFVPLPSCFSLFAFNLGITTCPGCTLPSHTLAREHASFSSSYESNDQSRPIQVAVSSDEIAIVEN